MYVRKYNYDFRKIVKLFNEMKSEKRLNKQPHHFKYLINKKTSSLISK